MSLDTARKAVRATFVSSCVGGVVMVLGWVFLMHSSWLTAIAFGLAWLLITTLAQVLMAWFAERKRERTTPR